jgi:hypothetical protein
MKEQVLNKIEQKKVDLTEKFDARFEDEFELNEKTDRVIIKAKRAGAELEPEDLNFAQGVVTEFNKLITFEDYTNEILDDE